MKKIESINEKELKRRYDKKLKRMGFECECGGLSIFEKMVGINKISPFKEEIIHLNKCNKCQKELKITSKPQKKSFHHLSKEELKKEFMDTIIQISKDKQLKQDIQLKLDYIKSIKKDLFMRFLSKFTEEELKEIERCI